MLDFTVLFFSVLVRQLNYFSYLAEFQNGYIYIFFQKFIVVSCALMFVCMYVCLRVSDPLKQELQTIVSSCVLGIDPGSSEGKDSACNC